MTVVNKHASRARGYTFPVGPITVTGDRALAYVRERYALLNGDLDRAERQRDVVRAILAKGLSADTVANPARFRGFVTDFAEHMTADSQLSAAEIRRTALSLRLTADDVEQLQAPISGFATVRGASIDVVDRHRLRQLATALQQDKVGEYLDEHPGR